MILRALLLVLVVAVYGTFSQDVQLSESFGGPHGTEFSDEASVVVGQTVGSITIRAGERVDGISLEVTGPKAATFSHGGTGGSGNTLTFAAGERITSMEAHWGKKSGRTRIFYLSFGTSAGNSVSGGSMTEDKNSVTAPEGFQLGGFFGRDGDEIDSLGAIWARIEAPPAATEPPAPVTEAPAPSKGAPAADPSGSGAPPAESTAASEASAEGSAAATSVEATGVASAAGSEAPPPPGTEAPAPPAAPSISVEDSVQLSESFGGPHGTEFSDEAAATSGQTVASITIRAESASTSGGASTDEDIVLSPVHGGPHGVAFSDVRSIVLGQTLSSVTLRGDRRVDAVTLQVATPVEQTWTHGGKGGKETTLALGPGEYINSVEFHWGKKDERIRVFYGNFGTSAGNSLSAGTKTEETATETAPEGFQLSGLHGRAENEVDQLGCIWARIDAKPALLTDVVDTAWFGDIIPGIFTSVKTLYKGAKLLYMCAANVINVIKQLIYYFRYVQTTAPQGDTENMLAVSYQSNVVLVDLPIAIYACLGMPAPQKLVFAGYVVTIVENIVKQEIVNGDEIISSAKNVVDLLKNSSAANNSASSVTELEDFIAANTSCGFELKQLTDRVLVTVNDLRNKTPDAAVNDVRVAFVNTAAVHT
ncbi:hypothetical protein PI124_g14121 [Phytophthora idaei]|nr:hypothetical protein PI124_g14121 [Phytophthora idaei]